MNRQYKPGDWKNRVEEWTHSYMVDGEPPWQIAERAGCTASTVVAALRRVGVEIRTDKNPRYPGRRKGKIALDSHLRLPTAEDRVLFYLWERPRPISLDELEEALPDISNLNRILALLAYKNVLSRHREEQGSLFTITSSALHEIDRIATDKREVARFKSLYTSGMSNDDLAIEFGISPNSVSYYRTKLGIDPRPPQRNRFPRARRISYYAAKLGAELRDARISVEYTQDEAGAHLLHPDGQKLSRIELGEQPPNYHEMRALLKLYGISDEQCEPFVHLLEQALAKRWWRSGEEGEAAYARMEALAVVRQEFQQNQVPDLLQTAEYARRTLHDPDGSNDKKDADALLRVTLKRQERLYRDPTMNVHVILEESILLADEMMDHGQLSKLLEVSQWDNVTLQVISSGPRSPAPGSFTLLACEPNYPLEFAYLDSASGSKFEKRDEKALAVLARIFNDLQEIALTPLETTSLLRDQLRP